MIDQRRIKSIFRNYIDSWLRFIGGLLGILSFGWIHTDWEFLFALKCVRKDIKKRQQKEKIQEELDIIIEEWIEIENSLKFI